MSEENKNILKEIEEFCKIYNLDFSKVEMDSNGLWIYNGHINVSTKKNFKTFPKCFKYLKEIKGSLNCYQTSIKDFKGLENLQTIEDSLWCYRTYITSFVGLESLKTIRGSLSCNSTPLTSFEGLESLKTIGKGLICANTNIKSFEGLENVKININNFYPPERREEFLYFKREKDFTNILKQALK